MWVKDFNLNLLLLSESMPQKSYKGYCQSAFSSTHYCLIDLMALIENLKFWSHL